MAPPLLSVEGLSVSIGGLPVVEDVSFTLERGEMMGLVGESGCGKSVTALTLMRLMPEPPARVVSGHVRLEGVDIASLGPDALRAVRGDAMAMIFQEPMTSLNPVFTVGDQIAEAYRLHRQGGPKAARERAIDLLNLVGIPAPAKAVDRFPHELSGGQRQRAMIAMALACEPKLLIADEPTTALDVTVQAQILELIDRLRRELGMAVLLITHDLGVVSEFCDKVAVMYAGRIVEEARAAALFEDPAHRYTAALMRTMPAANPPGRALPIIAGTVPPPGQRPRGCAFASRCDAPLDVCRERLPPWPDGPHPHLCWNPGSPAMGPLEQEAVDGSHAPEPDSCVLEVRDLSKIYRTSGGEVRALDGVSFELGRGEILGVVGESGCGKSTLGRAVLQLIEPSGGQIRVDGEDLASLPPASLKQRRRKIQMVFQDPYGSLNPRHRVGYIVREPLDVHKVGTPRERDARVSELLTAVGLPSDAARRYPHQFSGGQRQRIAIARALALSPEIIVADEPVSALDVSIQSQIINMIAELRERLGLSIIFISHDLSVVRHVSNRIAVMYLGRIVEIGPADAIIESPAHPYTQALLSAVPRVGGATSGNERIVLKGEPPDPGNPPSGCPFHARCAHATPRSATERPELRARRTPAGIRAVACHLYEPVADAAAAGGH